MALLYPQFVGSLTSFFSSARSCSAMSSLDLAQSLTLPLRLSGSTARRLRPGLGGCLLRLSPQLHLFGPEAEKQAETTRSKHIWTNEKHWGSEHISDSFSCCSLGKCVLVMSNVHTFRIYPASCTSRLLFSSSSCFFKLSVS